MNMACLTIWCFSSSFSPTGDLPKGEVFERDLPHLVSWSEYPLGSMDLLEGVHWTWPPVLWGGAGWEECHVLTILFTLQTGIVMHSDGDVLLEIHLVMVNEVSRTGWLVLIWQLKWTAKAGMNGKIHWFFRRAQWVCRDGEWYSRVFKVA